jgi:hypothetical protein
MFGLFQGNLWFVDCSAQNLIARTAPYYAFSQTMFAELAPAGYDNMVSVSH